MAVGLQINDGNPWWLSPDVWTVPGTDPNGPPGTPIAGQPAFLWARVHNLGSDGVQNAKVRFWWANPGTNFDRTTASQVGLSYVTLAPGEQQEVLCLTPWTFAYVNGGHECILAEAFDETYDPLPPGSNFNVPTDRHVAQRNLNLVMTTKRRVTVPFEVHNDQRRAAVFTVAAEAADVGKLDERLIATLGKQVAGRLRPGTVQRLGLARTVCPDEDETGPPVQQIELRAGQRAGFTAVVEARGATLVHITQAHEGTVIGGLSVLTVED